MDEVLEQLSRPKARAASAVLIDVKTGGILAMTSRPSMDPNDFTSKMDGNPNIIPQGNYDPMNPGLPPTGLFKLYIRQGQPLSR